MKILFHKECKMIRETVVLVKPSRKSIAFLIGLLMAVFSPTILLAQYIPSKSRDLKPNEIPIDAPGFYGKSGATYLLTQDIRSDRSGIFLGNDVTLDLNGYTLTFADGKYGGLSNPGFEEGTTGWDLSKAPGAEVVNTKDVHVFVGDKLLSLEKGDEVVSEYLHLPLSNRSYYAMCGITGHHFSDMKGDLANEMKISIYVEDEQGREVQVTTEYADSTKISSPVVQKSPRLGGGFIFAHLNKLPAGKYRIRVKAETDCLIDEVDILPAMDVGVGIVGETHAMGHYDHLYNSQHTAFFDYTEDSRSGKPLAGIPQAFGKGTVTIKNGTIKSAAKGVVSWGVQSTANDVKVVLDNVKIINQGYNAIAVDVPQASITHCTFEVDNPFLINRHGSEFYAVDLTGTAASEVAYSEFYGGQGCLSFKGKRSSIHHNYFANRQMVTNHYSIMAMGDSSLIFENKIEPQVGSGIEIFRHKGIEIFNNVIKVAASPPTCEYGNEEYSVAAIRIADYNAAPGSEGAAVGNRVYNNEIHVQGKAFPENPLYTPMVWAVFYSASGGDNEVFGNQIFVEHLDPGSKSDVAAFYVCGGVKGFGGQFYDNRITTNVPAAWIASRYGGASNTRFSNNKIINSAADKGEIAPIRIGWESCKSCYATEVVFSSNEMVGMSREWDVTDQQHSFKVYYTLTVELTDPYGRPLSGEPVTVLNADQQQVAEGKSNQEGKWSVALMDYFVQNGAMSEGNSYKIISGSASAKISAGANQNIILQLEGK